MLFCLVLVVFMCEIPSLESKLMLTFKNELELLKDSIRLPLNSAMNLVEKDLGELEQKSYIVQEDAVNLIEQHTLNVVENFQLFSKAFSLTGKNISRCHAGVNDAVETAKDKGISRIRKAASTIIVRSGGVALVGKPLLNKIQNKTFEVQKTIQDCLLRVEDREKCLHSVLEDVEISKGIMPSLIVTIIDRVKMEINVLESELVAQVQNSVNDVVQAYTDILFAFIECIM
ncbi:unnamed protein product [Tenebrio molitor]|nr:unnamed protein product [Tenebrio molitor]